VIKATSDTFEQALQENLSLYTSPSQSENLFSFQREVSIARFALSQQAIAYHKATLIFMAFLEDAENQPVTPQLLTSVMQQLSAIENKSRSLIESVQKVTSLLGQAVNIDVDKAALRTMLLNLPGLVEQTIITISGDSSLAQDISVNLNNRISEMMVSLRFSDGREADNMLNGGQTQGITFDQFNNLLNSVPTQP
jgi:hypothetical protein